MNQRRPQAVSGHKNGSVTNYSPGTEISQLIEAANKVPARDWLAKAEQVEEEPCVTP
ncbi:integrase [Pseudomonas sp. SWI7]|nr:integrase [Pseudomonas sp. SWI7]